MIKHLDDYIDILHEKFPDIPKEEIERVMRYGLRMYYRHTKFYKDVCVKTTDFYTNATSFNFNNYRQYSSKQNTLVSRFRYSKADYMYDGYYYVGLTDDEFKTYKRLKKKRFIDVILYKLRDECFRKSKYKHFFKVSYPINGDFKIEKDVYYCEDAKYFAKREDDNQITFL